MQTALHPTRTTTTDRPGGMRITTIDFTTTITLEDTTMNVNTLQATARSLVDSGKDMLAMDESTPTCGRRLEAVGVGVEASLGRYDENLERVA